MSAQPHPRLTPEQYLAIERAAEFKSEYYNGEMFAMSGGSSRHAIIAMNIGAELRSGLRNKGCRVASSDLRVGVMPAGLYTYPDVVVVCGDLMFADHEKDTLVNPALLVEVLSPSSEAHDRGFKWEQYEQIESLREYVLVAQSKPRVEVYTRQPGGGWLFTDFTGLDAHARFPGVDCEIPLAEIYLGVSFEARD
jgi:Uma2 family endonuclease